MILERRRRSELLEVCKMLQVNIGRHVAMNRHDVNVVTVQEVPQAFLQAQSVYDNK